MPYSLDIPTIAETIATARAMLSPRARAGLDAQPADERGRTAHAVATGGCLAEWDRHLSEGQPWPDVIEYAALARLPDGRIVRPHTWLESLPPQPQGITVVPVAEAAEAPPKATPAA